MSGNEEVEVPIDKLARVYRKIQTKIQELTAKYENEVEVLKEQQAQIKDALKDKLQALGVTSVNTLEGTVILSTKTRYIAKDWDEFKQFIMEHDAVDLLEKRIAQGNMATFLKENPNLVPPGLDNMREYGITVRKPKQ